MRHVPCLVAFLLATLPAAFAQPPSDGARILLGGGYLEEPSTGYLYAQVGWTPYQDDSFAHTLFLEGLFHGDDSRLDFFAPGGALLFSEDADIVFANLTANYELEFKIAEPFFLFAGGGAGAELISINDRFDESVDDDANFVAQVFAGLRVRLGDSLDASAGVRRIFREDFSLLGDQFSTEDAWGFDLGVSFRF